MLAKASNDCSTLTSAETLNVAERQRIVRLLVKDVLVGDNDITIRHSIPIPSGSPPNGGKHSAGDPNYLLCTGSDPTAACERLLALRVRPVCRSLAQERAPGQCHSRPVCR